MDPIIHETSCNVIDPRDVRTPDAWIPRDPRLIRLTGDHPFNCEPPLDDLMSQGPITVKFINI